MKNKVTRKMHRNAHYTIIIRKINTAHSCQLLTNFADKNSRRIHEIILSVQYKNKRKQAIIGAFDRAREKGETISRPESLDAKENKNTKTGAERKNPAKMTLQ